jgi:hypothetical protein
VKQSFSLAKSKSEERSVAEDALENGKVKPKSRGELAAKNFHPQIIFLDGFLNFLKTKAALWHGRDGISTPENLVDNLHDVQADTA